MDGIERGRRRHLVPAYGARLWYGDPSKELIQIAPKESSIVGTNWSKPGWHFAFFVSDALVVGISRPLSLWRKLRLPRAGRRSLRVSNIESNKVSNSCPWPAAAQFTHGWANSSLHTGCG